MNENTGKIIFVAGADADSLINFRGPLIRFLVSEGNRVICSSVEPPEECTDKIKKQSGIRFLALAWHETNHIAMAYGDYSRFAFMEDMLNSQLNYINDVADSYILHPQEKINYALEKQFIEECVARIGIKQLDNTFKPMPAFDVATQYIARSLKKEY